MHCTKRSIQLEHTNVWYTSFKEFLHIIQSADTDSHTRKTFISWDGLCVTSLDQLEGESFHSTVRFHPIHIIQFGGLNSFSFTVTTSLSNSYKVRLFLSLLNLE